MRTAPFSKKLMEVSPARLFSYFVGWAKAHSRRAHHRHVMLQFGGHASLCPPYAAFVGSPILSCVFVSKSLASWRSCNWLAGSPEMRLTMRPRFTAGRFAIASVQRCTFLYSCTERNSPAP